MEALCISLDMWLSECELRRFVIFSLFLKDRERLLEELEQMQAQDRMRRKQVVAQMPPQLSVPPCKRMEIKEEWQRELESAFEEMYSEDRSKFLVRCC